MRIMVFGAGSIGCAMGGILSRKHEVVLVGRRENMEAVRAQGLHLTGDVEMAATVEARETVVDLRPPDLMVLTTKAYHTRAVVDALGDLPWDATSVVTFQNGLGSLEAIRRWKGAKAFGGTTTMGAVLQSPGRVRISGMGRIVVGSDIDPQGADIIAQALASCGLHVEVKEDISSEIWSKAVVNACINPVTAILRVNNGRLLESEVVTRLMSETCDECVAVAEASGVKLPEGRMFDRVRRVAEETSGNRSSMLRDVESGRRTEVSHINGVICRLGSSKGVPTPLNRAMVAMVEALQPGDPDKSLIS